MKPSWELKIDPQKHPVRFLASIWQQKMQANFGVSVSLSGKEMGQLRDLRLHLGDLTQQVIEWVVDPVNWWFFCQQVRKEVKNHRVSDYPNIDLLLSRRGSALRVMRSKLSNSSAGGEFVVKLDQKDYQQARALALVYAEDKAERLAQIAAATTLIDMKKVLNELMEVSAAS